MRLKLTATTDNRLIRMLRRYARETPIEGVELVCDAGLVDVIVDGQGGKLSRRERDSVRLVRRKLVHRSQTFACRLVLHFATTLRTL